jgi:aminobenzoyl-glutamate utilization protein B
MVRAGAFDDVDIALCWHPASFNGVNRAFSLACVEIEFTFSGRASHAAAAPHLGRSALDAVELMNVGVNYMREHAPSDARIHYAYLDAGGIAPNVVQASAKVRYAIRARDLAGMLELNERVKKIAEGAALMTETTVSISIMSAVSNMLGNTPLEDAMFRNIDRLGPVPFDAADKAYAAKIQATLGPADILNDYRKTGIAPRENTPLCDFVVPQGTRGVPMIGSTDVADVSWKVPTIQARVATHAIGTPGHSWQITAQGKAPAAHKGMVHAAKIMAATAIDVISDETLLARAKKDHQERVTQTPYVCPIPAEVKPPIKPRPVAA